MSERTWLEVVIATATLAQAEEEARVPGGSSFEHTVMLPEEVTPFQPLCWVTAGPSASVTRACFFCT